MYNYYIKFYVPSTADKDQTISNEQLTDRVDVIARVFSFNYGGATVEDCNGYYTANGGELIKEAIKRVVAFTDKETYQKTIEDIRALAVKSRNAWSQESIALETVQGIEFI